MDGDPPKRRGGDPADEAEPELGVCRVSFGGEVLEANDAMARLLGLDGADALVGRRTTDFYRDLDDREELIRELLEQSSVPAAEVEVRRADGRFARLVQACRLREESESGETVIEKRVLPASRADRLRRWLESGNG